MNNKKYTYNNENARTENIKKVISTLIAGETLSRADIAKRFNLNKATISDIIERLINDNLIKREFDNLIRYEVHQSQIWLIFFVKS